MDKVTRRDFEDAIRFVADAAMRDALDRRRLEALVRAVARALVERGELDVDTFEARLHARDV